MQTDMVYDVLDHHHKEAKDWVVVNWNLGNTCNYSCSYCPPVLNNGSYGWNDFNVIKKFIDTCEKHYAPRKVYFEFTGGEVTLWKDFIKCAQYIKSKGHDIGFISNASRTIRWWEKNKNNFDHVCLSFHPESAEADHFLEVVKIMSKVCRTHVNIMMHTDLDRFNNGIELTKKLVAEAQNFSLALQPLVIDFGTERFPYTDEQLATIDRQWEDFGKHIKYTNNNNFKLYRGSMDMINTKTGETKNRAAHRFIADNTNNWSGWKCYSGVEQIVVDFDGTVMIGWCRVGGSLGNMKDPDNIAWPVDPVICNKSYCHCNFDIMSKKERV